MGDSMPVDIELIEGLQERFQPPSEIYGWRAVAQLQATRRLAYGLGLGIQAGGFSPGGNFSQPIFLSLKKSPGKFSSPRGVEVRPRSRKWGHSPRWRRILLLRGGDEDSELHPLYAVTPAAPTFPWALKVRKREVGAGAGAAKKR